ncbi:hypothetical protein ACNOYE_39085 [Nannocystaceae bacterium ST9]
MTKVFVGFALTLGLGSSGCIVDRPASAGIHDPHLPHPTLCFGPVAPCGASGLHPHKTDELIITARPIGAPDGDAVVAWHVEPIRGFPRTRALYFPYAIVPDGWRERSPALPLAEGMVYEFQNIRFVVRGDRIRRIRN